MDYSETRAIMVDDHKGLLGLFKINLVNHGFHENNILLAESGVVALALYDAEIAAGRRIDIVITDTSIPLPKEQKNSGVLEIHGPQLMKMLRDKGYVGPIVQMSGEERNISHHGTRDKFVIKGAPDVLTNAIDELLSQPPEVKSETKLETKEKILVVEDDDGIRMCLHALLNFNGYDVIEASNVYQALGLMDEQVVAVISDMEMPHQSGGAVNPSGGPDLLSQLRQRFNYSGGFIAISGREIDKMKEKYAGHNPQPDAFIRKPYGNPEMVEAVKLSIAKHSGQASETGTNTTPFIPRELHL